MIPRIRTTNAEYFDGTYQIMRKHNSHGWRDYEYDHEKEDGVFRIVVLGDSVLNGHGVWLHEVFAKHEISHVAHLAALQTPDCNALRDLGLQINLGGTQKILEAIKASGYDLARFVFASSIAVYGARASYPSERVPMMAPPQPVNVYGTWKLASEQISEFFCDDTGIPTVCLRPGVLYGPGRDAGLTSTPTTAMKCVALGRPYEIPYRTRQDYLYAPDVGAAFGNALMEPFAGYGIFTLPARAVEMQDFVAAIRQAAEDVGLASQCRITFGTDEVPFICELEYEPFLEAFPNTIHTSLEVALRESLNVFREQASKGWLSAAQV